MKNQETKNLTDISILDGEKFIIDRRLLNKLIEQTEPTDIFNLKEKLRVITEQSNTVDVLMQRLDDFVYIQNVINLIEFPKNEKL